MGFWPKYHEDRTKPKNCAAQSEFECDRFPVIRSVKTVVFGKSVNCGKPVLATEDQTGRMIERLNAFQQERKLNFQISIRGALYITTAIAVYSSILALAYGGDPWGRGITFAVTGAFSLWIFSTFIYWMLILAMKIFGVEELGESPLVPQKNRVESSTDSLMDVASKAALTEPENNS